MAAIHKVAIISKPGSDLAVTIVPRLLAWLKERGIETRCDEHTAGYADCPEVVQRAQVPDGVQLVIVLGGDGTLLSAARAIAGRAIPLFAVNLGGLGFLTAITVDELFPELDRALRGEFRIAPRRMLHCEVLRGDRKIAEYDALNDVVLSKSALARMIDLDTSVDGHFVCSYKADGLIISTPTGSTAYSLSAGGPIVFPQVDALLITPICPHMLTNRPVIVPAESRIQVTSFAEEDTGFLTIDGQIGERLEHGDRIICSMSDKTLCLIRPPQMLYFDVLRAKLKWGER